MDDSTSGGSPLLPESPSPGPAENSPAKKSTFKTVLQAKKRLQAFSPVIKKHVRETAAAAESPPAEHAKKPSKPANNPTAKAKLLIEELEEIKREEQAQFEALALAPHQRRSRSRSNDKERFKKVDKRAPERSYRRRSPTPEKQTRRSSGGSSSGYGGGVGGHHGSGATTHHGRSTSGSHRESSHHRESSASAALNTSSSSSSGHQKTIPPKKVYPKNWKEFKDNNFTFNLNKEFDVQMAKGDNELLRLLLFNLPPLPINPFKMKTVDDKEKLVPFEYLRFTRVRPAVAYSVNHDAIKVTYPTRKEVFGVISKVQAEQIEKLYSNSAKFQSEEQGSKPAVRHWNVKSWTDNASNCKLLENSIGLSFLQSYTGEEEEEEEEQPSQLLDTSKSSSNKSEKKKQAKEEVVRDEVSVTKKKTKDKDDGKKKKKKKNKKNNKNNKKKSEVDEAEEEEEDEAEKKAKKKKKDKRKVKGKKKHHKHDAQSSDDDDEEEDSIEQNAAKKKKKKLKEKKKKKLATAKGEENIEDKETTEGQQKATPKKVKEDKDDKEKRKKKNKRGEKRKARASISTTDGEGEAKKSKRKTATVATASAAVRYVDRKRHRGFENNDDPDTDEYHSHWEVDDEVATSISRQKMNRSWESDEELFGRAQAAKAAAAADDRKKDDNGCENLLEIPLNLNIPRKNRSSNSGGNTTATTKWNAETEIRLLEEERRSISEERRKLALERERLQMMQKEATSSTPTTVVKSSTPEYFDLSLVKQEVLDAVNADPLPTSNVPAVALESEYEEFIRAVSSGEPSTKTTTGSNNSWSETPSSSSSDEEQSSRKRKKKKLKDKKRKKKLKLLSKGNKFNEFDIPVPGDLVDEPPPHMPLPVPSPLQEVYPPLPLDKPAAVAAGFAAPIELTPPIPVTLINAVLLQQPPPPPPPEPAKPFVFNSITLSSKKPAVLKCSNVNLGDSSDDDGDFTDKLHRHLQHLNSSSNNSGSGKDDLLDRSLDSVDDGKMAASSPPRRLESDDKATGIGKESKDVAKKTPEAEPVVLKQLHVGDHKDEEKKKNESDKYREDGKKKDEGTPAKMGGAHAKSQDRRRSRSREPRFRRSRSRDRSGKKLSPPPPSTLPRRRRSLTPPPSRRSSGLRSPRRRSSPSSRRRTSYGSGKRYRSRTPPSRRSPAGGASPLRRSGRKRTPSPVPTAVRRQQRRGASPLASPLDGFKRSVADSTISDDMLPQPSSSSSLLDGDYSDSPPASSGYYGDGRRHGRRSRKSESPSERRSGTLSPKRISLDDRINMYSHPQVLGIEKSEMKGGVHAPPPPEAAMYVAARAAVPPGYHQQQQHHHGYPYDQYAGTAQYPYSQHPHVQYNMPPPPSAGTPHHHQQQQHHHHHHHSKGGDEYSAAHYPNAAPAGYEMPPPKMPAPSKVVQVGNILQVVPHEDMPPPPKSKHVVHDVTPQKIVQVGNMLQIVPSTSSSMPPPPMAVPKPEPVAVTAYGGVIAEVANAASLPVAVVAATAAAAEKQSAESLMKQTIAERKAEREKRRSERERRRKDKERKRKERDKKKQLKLKLKTENMIKRALQLEAEEGEEGNDGDGDADAAAEGEEDEAMVTPTPIIVTGGGVSSTATPTKGILMTGGFSHLERKARTPEQRKSVQFADGVRPGEGTSPSGGEELSSPPPATPQLPKEKRYTKLKTPKKAKKKKIKVKVIKTRRHRRSSGGATAAASNAAAAGVVDEDDLDGDENLALLPPPSPPPGSPPPHVFPSRVKTHVINNVVLTNPIVAAAAAHPHHHPHHLPSMHAQYGPPPGAAVQASPQVMGPYRPPPPPVVMARGGLPQPGVPYLQSPYQDVRVLPPDHYPGSSLANHH